MDDAVEPDGPTLMLLEDDAMLAEASARMISPAALVSTAFGAP